MSKLTVATDVYCSVTTVCNYSVATALLQTTVQHLYGYKVMYQVHIHTYVHVHVCVHKCILHLSVILLIRGCGQYM